MSRGRIFGQSFGDVQQLSHVPVDLFRRFATEIDPLRHVRVVKALQNFVQKCDSVILSEIHIHLSGV